MNKVSAGISKHARKPTLPPPFPAVAVQLIQQMQQPNVTATEVGRLIELDPSLTASLLRLVNSPFFGMRRQLASVPESVMVLGMGAVRRMVLSLAVVGPRKSIAVDPEYMREQWKHTVSCAALARRLIDDDPAAADVAFTAGLLHDMGEVHLLQEHGAAYASLCIDAGERDRRPQEVERFGGRAHDELGAELLESWGLPQTIADAARTHHAPSAAGLSLVQQAVWMANRIAQLPEGTAQLSLTSPAGLVPVRQAVDESRAEIDTLSSLLNS